MAEIETVTVNLLGKKYQVSCQEDEVALLEKSAKYLNKKMGEIRDSGRVVGLDRIAVMAALNIIGESITFLSGDFTEKINPNTKRIVIKIIVNTNLSEILFILSLIHI